MKSISGPCLEPDLLNFVTRTCTTVLLAWLLANCATPEVAPFLPSIYRNMDTVRYELFGRRRSWSWEKMAPHMQEIHIPSSYDGGYQRALYFNPAPETPRPLLIVLHSWSSTYRQSYSLPYAQWAQENKWALILPDFRGRFNGPEAASEAAQQDVLDARKYALENGRIDTRRIYMTGYSGGATVAQLLGARFPDSFTAIASWSPIYDLNQWYSEIYRKDWHYPGNIRAICGGAPLFNDRAYQACQERSPSAYLNRKAQSRVHILLATGLDDNLVPASHSLWIYNRLVKPAEVVDLGILGSIRYQPDLENVSEDEKQIYSDAGADLLFARRSDRKHVRIYYGQHDVIYNAGLYWLRDKRK